MYVFQLQSPHKTLDTALPQLAELGYDGIEIPLKAIFQYGKERFKSLLAKCNLKANISTTFENYSKCRIWFFFNLGQFLPIFDLSGNTV